MYKPFTFVVKSVSRISQQVDFYGDDLTAVRVASGTVFIPVRPICERLGVDWNGQRRRINRDPVLRDELRTVDVTSTEGSREVTRAVLCLPLDYISGFLFGINAERVRTDLRDRVIRYQKECYKVLAEAFQDGRLTADPVFSELLERDSEAVEAYKMIAAMLKLARNQVLLESRLDAHHHQIADHEQRLEEIEQQLFPGEPVTQSQAMQISQAVKTVAFVLGKKTGRNEHPAIYGELYRRYEINSYKLLPANKFEDAMTWLNEWYQEVAGGTPF